MLSQHPPKGTKDRCTLHPLLAIVSRPTAGIAGARWERGSWNTRRRMCGGQRCKFWFSWLRKATSALPGLTAPRLDSIQTSQRPRHRPSQCAPEMLQNATRFQLPCKLPLPRPPHPGPRVGRGEELVAEGQELQHASKYIKTLQNTPKCSKGRCTFHVNAGCDASQRKGRRLRRV